MVKFEKIAETKKPALKPVNSIKLVPEAGVEPARPVRVAGFAIPMNKVLHVPLYLILPICSFELSANKMQIYFSALSSFIISN